MLTSVYLSLQSKPSAPSSGRLFKNVPKTAATTTSVTKEVTVPSQATKNEMQDSSTNKLESTPANFEDAKVPADNMKKVDVMKKDAAIKTEDKMLGDTSAKMKAVESTATQASTKTTSNNEPMAKKIMADKVEALKDTVANLSLIHI